MQKNGQGLVLQVCAVSNIGGSELFYWIWGTVPVDEPDASHIATKVSVHVQREIRRSMRTTRCRQEGSYEINLWGSGRTVMRHKVFAVSLSQTHPKRNGARIVTHRLPAS